MPERKAARSRRDAPLTARRTGKAATTPNEVTSRDTLGRSFGLPGIGGTQDSLRLRGCAGLLKRRVGAAMAAWVWMQPMPCRSYRPRAIVSSHRPDHASLYGYDEVVTRSQSVLLPHGQGHEIVRRASRAASCRSRAAVMKSSAGHWTLRTGCVGPIVHLQILSSTAIAPNECATRLVSVLALPEK